MGKLMAGHRGYGGTGLRATPLQHWGTHNLDSRAISPVTLPSLLASCALLILRHCPDFLALTEPRTILALKKLGFSNMTFN